MYFEFTYFFDPMAEESPIQKLHVHLDLEFKYEPHPANALFKTYRIEIQRLRVFSKIGIEVTSEFAHHRSEIEKHFRTHHQDNALNDYILNHR